MLVVLRENSGSISHTVAGIGSSLIDGEERFAIDIKRKIPEAATADMAEWHIIIEPEVGLQEFIHGGAEVRLTVGDKSYELVAEREDVSESAEQ